MKLLTTPDWFLSGPWPGRIMGDRYVLIDFEGLDVLPWCDAVRQYVFGHFDQPPTYKRNYALTGYVLAGLFPVDCVEGNCWKCSIDHWFDIVEYKQHYRNKDFPFQYPRQDFTTVQAMRDAMADESVVHIIVDRQVRDCLVEEFETFQDQTWVAPYEQQRDGLLMVLDGKGIFTDAALPDHLKWVNTNQGDSGRPQFLTVNKDHAKYYEEKQ